MFLNNFAKCKALSLRFKKYIILNRKKKKIAIFISMLRGAYLEMLEFKLKL